MNRPPLCLSDVCRPPLHALCQCSDPKTDCRDSVDESVPMARGWRVKTLRMGGFPVFSSQVLYKTQV